MITVVIKARNALRVESMQIERYLITTAKRNYDPQEWMDVIPIVVDALRAYRGVVDNEAMFSIQLILEGLIKSISNATYNRGYGIVQLREYIDDINNLLMIRSTKTKLKSYERDEIIERQKSQTRAILESEIMWGNVKEISRKQTRLLSDRVEGISAQMASDSFNSMRNALNSDKVDTGRFKSNARATIKVEAKKTQTIETQIGRRKLTF